jgi:endogenous inhibitor of DNA gyrase (YacG/DUF329 family)
MKKGVVLNCSACSKDYYVPKYRALISKFCSHQCQNKLQYINSTFKCLECSNEFTDSPSRKNRKFCSIECKNHNSLSEKQARIRQKASAILSRGYNSNRFNRKLLKRSGIKFKCAICDYDEYDFCIDCHHIDENPNNNSLENIIMLCVMCHRKLHKGIIKLNEVSSIKK